MKQLSRLFFGVLAVLLMISSVRSQTFEGTIAMEIIMHQNNEQIIPVTISSKGTNTLMEMEMPQVGSVKMFYDHKAGKITSVMEAMNMGMEMGNGNGKMNGKRNGNRIGIGKRNRIKYEKPIQ